MCQYNYGDDHEEEEEEEMMMMMMMMMVLSCMRPCGLSSLLVVFTCSVWM
jgi:hypothetical protein